MIITKLTGGLGNQMFQYAAGRAASLRNQTELTLDNSFFQAESSTQKHEKLLIENVFPNISGLNLRIISFLEKRTQLERAFNLMRRKLHLQELFKQITEPLFLTYYPSFHYQNAKILYLTSDWQNEKYFIKYEKEIRKDFSFSESELSFQNTTILKLIKNTNSVSVHIRRGDYLQSSAHSPTSNIFYENAVDFCNKKLNNPIYFIFSDDIEWCKNNLKLKEAHYVSWNTSNNSYLDMQLMSNCKHNIIANSSFSWWGAWLNNNPHKIVIAPENWMEKLNVKSENIIPDRWITL